MALAAKGNLGGWFAAHILAAGRQFMAWYIVLVVDGAVLVKAPDIGLILDRPTFFAARADFAQRFALRAHRIMAVDTPVLGTTPGRTC
jgi:hypothetical protein